MMFYKKKKVVVDNENILEDTNIPLENVSPETKIDTDARYVLTKSGIIKSPIVKNLPIVQDGYVYLFAVYDKLSQRYTYPIPQVSVEIGVRYFLTLLSHEDPKTRHDYQLFILGEYDPSYGTFAIYEEPTFVKEGNENNA